MAGEDFVHVKLSKRGEELAKDAPITVVHGNSQFTFKLGEKPQRVTRAIEWNEILDRVRDDVGALFEIDEKQAAAVSGQLSGKPAAAIGDDNDESGPANRQAKSSV